MRSRREEIVNRVLDGRHHLTIGTSRLCRVSSLFNVVQCCVCIAVVASCLVSRVCVQLPAAPTRPRSCVDRRPGARLNLRKT